MANTLYNQTRQDFGTKAWAILEDYPLYPGPYGAPPYATGLKVALVDNTYVPDLNAHAHFSDLVGVIATSAVLTGSGVTQPPSFTLGLLDADDITMTGVPATSIQYLVIYSETGNPLTSRLVALIDSASGTIPVVPTPTVTIQWNALGICLI